MKFKYYTLLLAITFIACKSENTATTEKEVVNETSMEFNSMLDEYYEEGLKLNPLNATMSGDNRYNDKFPDVLSDEYKEELTAYYNRYRKAVMRFDDANLTDTEQMSKEVLLWDIDVNLEGMKFKKDLTPIDQMWSPHLMFGQLASGASAQPFKTLEDYRNWQLRVDEYLVWLNSAEENMRKGMEEGYVLPKSLIKKVIPQMDAMTTADVENHLFYTPVTNFPEGISEEDQEILRTDYKNMIEGKIIPAYTKLSNFLKDEYLAAGRDSSGYSDLPQGSEYYDYAIKYYTTTNMTADEIHQLGLSEVARIRKEMEKVKEQVGFKGDLKAFFDDVRTNKELMPYSTPEEIIANFEAMHETIKPQVDELFSVQPKTAFEVRRTEEFREKSASAEYNPGSLDGTRPGIFYTPIPDAKTYNVYSDESLFLHEAIPGHHFQISLTQESETLPQFRKTLWYSAYGEGWALYTESLGKELGLYTDPYQYFGTLGAEMHRAVRLVVDTGIHTKGWSREKAIAYCLENEAESEAGITSEIERYMAMPGQALSYKIGQLKIRELRERATQELGDKFDIREFHKEVLETGCIPLALLESKIDNWIASAK
ncbi:DUF885 domain-containing protein [Dokdonia sp. Hel_I_53]|uniref:DUF885 domain-containing protein n=1 Tax=Dokdonia sp. Hel_I_53 TaxID=1566287 RepID=UPI001199DA74|nr:DUF885 domain-containing protein [Dokdonia sp. Hel_I_53]TVZ52017.1 uncharacterized protein (DUF885 family) [Dokdonia sp. Hel_I_53]